MSVENNNQLPNNNQNPNHNSNSSHQGNKQGSNPQTNQGGQKRFYPNKNRGYYNRNKNNNAEAPRDITRSQEHVREAGNDKREPQKDVNREGQNSTQQFGNQRRRNNYNNQRDRRDVKVEETVEDIKRDINRINKEIELEIKEITALKMGIG